MKGIGQQCGITHLVKANASEHCKKKSSVRNEEEGIRRVYTHEITLFFIPRAVTIPN
jgi:hypothetical protein